MDRSDKRNTNVLPNVDGCGLQTCAPFPLGLSWCVLKSASSTQSSSQYITFFDISVFSLECISYYLKVFFFHFEID